MFSYQRVAIGLMAFTMFIVGALGSLGVVFRLFPIEPDAVQSVILWQEVHKHGVMWLKEWIFTQDNWLLSLIPFHFALFWLFGAENQTVILSGWIIFVSCAILSGEISRHLGGKISAVIAPLVLIFVGIYAHQYGYVSYSNSHNLSNLVGLGSVLAMIRWVKTRKLKYLGYVGCLHIAAAVSDPWLIPAYTLPFALATGVYMLLSKTSDERKSYASAFAVMLISLFLIKTQLFGLLDFLPRLQYRFGSLHVILSNGLFLIRDLGGLFNLIPGAYGNDISSSLIPVLSILLLLLFSYNYLNEGRSDKYLFWHKLVGALKSRERISYLIGYFHSNEGVILSGSNGFPLLVILFSVVLICLAFCLSNVEAKDYSGRFLLNVLYLGVIGLSFFIENVWRRISVGLKGGWITILCLFTFSGAVSDSPFWRTADWKANTENVDKLINFLDAENLDYGYGPYWRSHANVVTELTESRIRIRPVMFTSAGRMRFERPQSSRLWINEDVSSKQRDTFVFVAGENGFCKDITVCLNGLSQQFGPPFKRYQYESSYILVWDGPLANRYEKIHLNDEISFTESKRPPMWWGWSFPESSGTWTIGEVSELRYALTDRVQTDLEMTVEGRPFLNWLHPQQRVDVFVNGHPVAQWAYESAGKAARRARIPLDLVKEHNRQLTIVFNIQYPNATNWIGLSSDGRKHGIHVSSLQFKPIDR